MQSCDAADYPHKTLKSLMVLCCVQSTPLKLKGVYRYALPYPSWHAATPNQGMSYIGPGSLTVHTR